MSNKRIKEFRNLVRDELATKSRELESTIFDLRMKKATGQLEDTASLWRARKDMARIRMLLAQGSEAEKSGLGKTKSAKSLPLTDPQVLSSQAKLKTEKVKKGK